MMLLHTPYLMDLLTNHVTDMGADKAIKKLETSNKELNTILNDLGNALLELRSDPRLEGLIDDLENLFHSYLKTWIKSNADVINILKQDSTKL